MSDYQKNKKADATPAVENTNRSTLSLHHAIAKVKLGLSQKICKFYLRMNEWEWFCERVKKEIG